MRAIYACVLVTFSATACMTSAPEDRLPPRLAGIELDSRSLSGVLPPNARVAPEKRDGSAAPTGEPMARQEGDASFYSDSFQGRKTATGERFTQSKLTAASPDLPLGTNVTVTNRENGKSVDVKVNDRGPNVGGRVIDLSKMAAKRIGIQEQGVAPVTIEARPSRQPTKELKDAVLDKASFSAPD